MYLISVATYIFIALILYSFWLVYSETNPGFASVVCFYSFSFGLM
jgi:hypothetical protein